MSVTRPGGAELCSWRFIKTKPMKMLKRVVQLCRLIEGPKPKGDLRPNKCKPPYKYNLYYKACTVSHRAGHGVYEPAGTP